MSNDAKPSKRKRKQRNDHGIPRGRRGPHEGSLFHWLSSFELGEVRYREFAFDAGPRAAALVRLMSAISRYPDSMQGWRFSGTRLLAVPAHSTLTPFIIVRVERTQ